MTPPDRTTFRSVRRETRRENDYLHFISWADGYGRVRRQLEQLGGQPKTFTVTLSPANETPPCANAGAGATGTAMITIPGDDSSVSVSLTYSGLSGPATAAHIHSGTASAAGPVVLPFSGSLASPFNTTLTAGNYVPAPGAPADFPTFVAALKAGGAGYVNVHTAACPAGEIRAEIE